jgi:hypothetical protein
LGIPLDTKVKELPQLPYTISYVIRKLQQIDNLNELPKEKRPTEDIIWDGTSEELEDWLDKVLSNKVQKDVSIMIKENEVEG